MEFPCKVCGGNHPDGECTVSAETQKEEVVAVALPPDVQKCIDAQLYNWAPGRAREDRKDSKLSYRDFQSRLLHDPSLYVAVCAYIEKASPDYAERFLPQLKSNVERMMAELQKSSFISDWQNSLYALHGDDEPSEVYHDETVDKALEIIKGIKALPDLNQRLTALDSLRKRIQKHIDAYKALAERRGYEDDAWDLKHEDPVNLGSGVNYEQLLVCLPENAMGLDEAERVLQMTFEQIDQELDAR